MIFLCYIDKILNQEVVVLLGDMNPLINYPMVDIPEGVIGMRDDRKKTQWTIEITPFSLAKYPVTVGLYNELKRLSKNSLLQESTVTMHDVSPVVNISWHEAIAFCNQFSRLSGLKECYTISSDEDTVICNLEAGGYRLPTEAEWQYACKAGTAGYQYGELDKIAWYKDNSEGRLHEVGGKDPNPWGLYDMLGNVWEWCFDLYDEEVYGTYCVFRGGSWAEEARGCGASCRRRSHPTFSIDDLGFRLAR